VNVFVFYRKINYRNHRATNTLFAPAGLTMAGRGSFVTASRFSPEHNEQKNRYTC
jgi:hypothetical protein